MCAGSRRPGERPGTGTSASPKCRPGSPLPSSGSSKRGTARCRRRQIVRIARVVWRASAGPPSTVWAPRTASPKLGTNPGASSRTARIKALDSFDLTGPKFSGRSGDLRSFLAKVTICATSSARAGWSLASSSCGTPSPSRFCHAAPPRAFIPTTMVTTGTSTSPSSAIGSRTPIAPCTPSSTTPRSSSTSPRRRSPALIVSFATSRAGFLSPGSP